MRPLATVCNLPAPPGISWVLASLVLATRVGESAGVIPGLVAAYLDDLLCLPCLLLLIHWAHRLTGRPRHWRLPAVHGVICLVFVAVVFEIVLPGLSIRYTADPWDVLAYGVGLVLYWLGGWMWSDASGQSAATRPATT